MSARGALAERPDPQCLRLYEQEYDYIFRTLRRFGASPADAEDLAQEMFLVMWRRWRDYDRRRPIRPWLAGIAYRLVYNHRTRISREVPYGLVDAPDCDRLDPEMQISLARTRGLVLRLLASLPEKQRMVMVLHEIDGMSIRDLAQLLAVPLFTAYSRLRAARAGFAAAVRRAHQRGGLDQPPLSQAALLEAERPLPPAPAAARRRALSRATALIARLGNEPPAPVPQATTGATKLLLGGAGAVALAVLAVVGWRPSTPRALIRPASEAARAAAAPAPAPGPLGRGLVGYWRFDDGPASVVARDLSGRGNDCRLRHVDPATSWVAGPHGGAIHLDGAGWLECPHLAAAERAASEVTIAVRVNRGSDTRLRALVSEQHGSGPLDTFHFGFRGDKLMIQSSLWDIHMSAPLPRARGHWVHVAATLGSDSVGRLYIDGEPVAHRGIRRPIADGGDNPLLVGGGQNGSNPDGVSERLTGTLDDLVIYDRALAPEEIAALAAGADPLHR